MELVKTGTGKVKFYLDTTFPSQYELDLETFERRKLLEEIRSDDNMTYIRENFFMYD